eukprot:4525035-Prymnesium_polylepis.1
MARVVGNGSRTILPHLLRGVIPPSMPYVSDRVIRSFTKTIIDLQRVVLDHRAGRLHKSDIEMFQLLSSNQIPKCSNSVPWIRYRKSEMFELLSSNQILKE